VAGAVGIGGGEGGGEGGEGETAEGGGAFSLPTPYPAAACVAHYASTLRPLSPSYSSADPLLTPILALLLGVLSSPRALFSPNIHSRATVSAALHALFVASPQACGRAGEAGKAQDFLRPLFLTPSPWVAANATRALLSLYAQLGGTGDREAALHRARVLALLAHFCASQAHAPALSTAASDTSLESHFFLFANALIPHLRESRGVVVKEEAPAAGGGGGGGGGSSPQHSRNISAHRAVLCSAAPLLAQGFAFQKSGEFFFFFLNGRRAKIFANARCGSQGAPCVLASYAWNSP
jgi:hypothetical protein